MHPLKLKVEQAFAAWQDKRRELEQSSRALEAALKALSEGQDADVEPLKTKLDALRRECDELFAQLLAAVDAARDAGVQ